MICTHFAHSQVLLLWSAEANDNKALFVSCTILCHWSVESNRMYSVICETHNALNGKVSTPRYSCKESHDNRYDAPNSVPSECTALSHDLWAACYDSPAKDHKLAIIQRGGVAPSVHTACLHSLHKHSSRLPVNAID